MTAWHPEGHISPYPELGGMSSRDVIDNATSTREIPDGGFTPTEIDGARTDDHEYYTREFGLSGSTLVSPEQKKIDEAGIKRLRRTFRIIKAIQALDELSKSKQDSNKQS